VAAACLRRDAEQRPHKLCAAFRSVGSMVSTDEQTRLRRDRMVAVRCQPWADNFEELGPHWDWRAGRINGSSSAPNSCTKLFELHHTSIQSTSPCSGLRVCNLIKTPQHCTPAIERVLTGNPNPLPQSRAGLNCAQTRIMATTSNMFLYSLTIQPPTHVVQAVLGQFGGTREQLIVTASG